MVLTTHVGGVKGRAPRRDPNAPLCVDDQEPPYSYVTNDKAELVIQPGPGRLQRSIMDYFLGPRPP